MSWTEIKHSVNSDLHKPLNELIEEKAEATNSLIKESGGGISGKIITRNIPAVGTGDSAVAVLEVTGSGSLVYFDFPLLQEGNTVYSLAEDDAARNIYLKVTIDDKVLLHVCQKNTQTYSSSTSPKNTDILLNVYSTPESLSNISSIFYADASSLDDSMYGTFELSDKVQLVTVDAGAHRYRGILLSKAIKFNQSLKIELIPSSKRRATYNTSYVAYTLDD